MPPADDQNAAAVAAEAVVREWTEQDISTEPHGLIHLSNGAINVSVSTATGRILSVSSTRSNLAAQLNPEVRQPIWLFNMAHPHYLYVLERTTRSWK